MDITLSIPDLLASSLNFSQPELRQMFLESFAVESYRQGTLSSAQVRVLMGHDSRWETEDFLAAHDAWPCTSAQAVSEDGQKLQSLLAQ